MQIGSERVISAYFRDNSPYDWNVQYGEWIFDVKVETFVPPWTFGFDFRICSVEIILTFYLTIRVNWTWKWEVGRNFIVK